MSDSTFVLTIKQGKLIIPPEIEDYFSQCPDNIQVSVTIKSESNELVNTWNEWFNEVEQSPSLTNKINPENDYEKLLINKYKEQGLEL